MTGLEGTGAVAGALQGARTGATGAQTVSATSGCHLKRKIAELIQDTGFQIDRMDTGYMKGPQPMTFMCEGSARARLHH